MILLKGFFRKKSTKVYLIIFSTLLTATILLFSVKNYYSDLENDFFQKNTYLLVVSKNDSYADFAKNRNVVNIKRVLLFKPDYTNDIFRKSNDKEETNSNSLMSWKELSETGTETIFVFSNNKNESKKSDNQISINISPLTIEAINIADLVDKNVSFNYDDKKISFIVKDINESAFINIYIAENVFNNLLDNSKEFTYILTIKSYENAKSMEAKLATSKNVKQVDLKQKMPDEKEAKTMEAVKGFLKSLKIASYFIIFSFLIVFFSIKQNIIKDENRNINIESLLGYNKNVIKKYLGLKIFALDILTYLISATFSIILLLITNKLLNFQFEILNTFLLFIIYTTSALISLFLCLFLRIKK